MNARQQLEGEWWECVPDVKLLGREIVFSDITYPRGLTRLWGTFADTGEYVTIEADHWDGGLTVWVPTTSEEDARSPSQEPDASSPALEHGLDT